MINTNLYKIRLTYFCAKSRRFRHINISNVRPWKFRPRSRVTTFIIIAFDGEQLSLFKSFDAFFALAFNVFDIYNVSNVTLKCRTRSRSAIFTVTPFDREYENLYTSSNHFCASSAYQRFEVNVTEYNDCSSVIWWQVSNSVSVAPRIFFTSSHRSRDFNIKQ